ncbi:hypothetical protein [Sandarakinorhabdus rubra]|uniref:hypothetical protein n=1 Tax=Sandarakinorhabdus rubra TaxID=2672568 RepID=UPI0013DB601E|nr:hypothetical protein [Sandarakinorhabdus rubra]
MPAAATRTIRSQVLFQRHFRLPGLSQPQPPGTYGLTAHQEVILGESFVTYRTIAAFLQLPALGAMSNQGRQVPISLDELDLIVRADWEAAAPMWLESRV